MSIFSRIRSAVTKRNNQLPVGYYGLSSMTSGGIVNGTTGMGTSIDKSESSYFQPTRLYTRFPLEILTVQSWAAKKAVDIRVRDMFMRPRRFLDVTPDRAKEIEKMMIGVDDAVRRAMIAGRQYGTSLLVMMTKEAPMETPLVPEQIREGDLTAIRVFHRYDCSVLERDYDIHSPTYGDPMVYNIVPSYGGSVTAQGMPFPVHASRCIRFDGIRDPSDTGFISYEQDWGVSILVPLVQTILHEAGLAQSVAHLAQEASIPVLSIEGLRESLAGMAPNEMSPDQIGQGINRLKSIYRILMLDKSEEEFARVPVQFGGIADLMDRSARRVAAAVDVPFSRFMQDAPRGMNATGDGEFRNYVMTFESERQMELPPVYDRIDEVVFRAYGLGDPVEYEWPSLLELTEQETTEKTHQEVLSLVEAINAGIIDEDEARVALDGNELFGELPGDAPGLPEPEVPLPGAASPPANGGDKKPANGKPPANGGDKK